MVHINYSFVFLLSAASVVLATFAQIETQLSFVSSNSTNWDNLLNAFPTTGGSLTEAIAILTAGENLAESLSTVSVVTAQNGPLNVNNATSILDGILPCFMTLQNALSVIVAKKPAFLVLLPGGVLQDSILNGLDNLNASSVEFANSFISVASASLSNLNTETNLKANVIEVFNSAIAAYSSV